MLFTVAFFLELGRINDLRCLRSYDDITDVQIQELDELEARFKDELDELNRLETEAADRRYSDQGVFPADLNVRAS